MTLLKTFKAMHLVARALVGGILRTAVLTRAAETNIGSTCEEVTDCKNCRAVVVVGTPVSQYQNCNTYSDRPQTRYKMVSSI